jgi:F0F1-type ATP synthase membrane subunit b/b'
MENSPQLLPDWTMLIQLAIFFACYWVLRILVFKPYLELLKLRKAKTVGLKENAVAAQARADKLHQEYEAFMTQERKKAAVWTEEARVQVTEEERRIVQEARNRAAQEIDSLNASIERQVALARVELLPQVGEYSSHIATKLVGRKMDATHFSREFIKNAQAETDLTGLKA